MNRSGIRDGINVKLCSLEHQHKSVLST